MKSRIHIFDGETHQYIDDPVVVKRDDRREQVARIRAESAPKLGPDGKVHNDFTVWLAMDHAKDSVDHVRKAIDGLDRCRKENNLQLQFVEGI